ncbi:MAG: TonB-dependent receptor [Pseudoxanthomonas sp.]
MRTRPTVHVLTLACALALAPLAQAQQTTGDEQQTTPTTTTEQKPATAKKADREAGSEQGQVKELETVHATGIRGSIATSMETKNEATSIVEAVSAEDIGKLPDISIADSISRLPGLATQRVDGRAQVINIRGMSEQFAGTLLNGREQVSTGDSRGVEFDQYPAELINSVVVYKTPDATLVGQGISGTVDLQSIRPLSLGKRRIVVSGQGEYNSLGELTAGGTDKGYRASFSYVDQFADDRIGVALGVAKLDSPFQEQHYKEWWWANGTTTDGWGGADQPGKPDDAIALQGSEGWVKSRELERTGAMGVLEFKPNDTWHSILDVYYSKFEQDELMRGAMWDNGPWFVNADGGSVDYANVGVSQYKGYPFVTSGTLTGVQPLVRNDHNLRQDKLYSAGWKNTFSADPWTFDVDLSYSRADRKQSTLETYAGLLYPVDVGFDIPLSNGFGGYSLPDLSDPDSVYLWDAQNYGHDGRLENSRQRDTIKAARFDLNQVVESSDFLRSYDIGFNYNHRTKAKSSQVYFLNLLDDAPTLVDSSLLSSPTSLAFLGMGSVLTYDPRELLSRYYSVDLSESNDDVLKDYTVDERVKTFYARANLDMDLSERVRLRGNVGVQYVRSEQSSTGYNATSGIIAGSQTLGTSYGDVLPSMNLTLDFGNGWLTRVAWAKTLMRAPINYLSAASSAGVSSLGEWSGSGGNPKLEPYRATGVDLSLEKYIGDASYLALALFYKELETYIYQQTLENYDFTGYPNDSGYTAHSNYGSFYTWANGSGGRMKGAELSATLSGDLVNDALFGFGVQLNASYTKSSIDPDGPGGSSTDTIPGLSKVVANATLYYEAHGFSARISERYRDRYRGEYSALFGQRQYRYTLPEHVVDLQLSYEFPQGSRLQGLSLLFQINNLNNEPFRTQVSESSGATGLLLPEEYTLYGRQYLLGFRYEL